MSISLLTAGVATLAGLAFTGLLLLRCARAPRLDLAALVCALAGLTVALAAQALGFSQGFTPVTFRAVQLGAELAAPVAVLWGLTEVLGKSYGARFAARLGLSALTVVCAVILATDPLSSAAFSRLWPAAQVHYQLIPNELLLAVAGIAVVWAFVAVVVTAMRARRDPEWHGPRVPVMLAGVAVVAAEGLRAAIPVNSGYPALCLAAAALIWLAGTRLAGQRLDDMHSTESTGWWTGPFTGPFTGPLARHRDDTGFLLYRDNTGALDLDSFDPEASDTFGALYRHDSEQFERDPGEFDDRYRPDTGEFDPGGAGQRGYPGGGYGPEDYRANGAPSGVEMFQTGDVLGAGGAIGEREWQPAGGDVSALYGQITIYTLHEGRAADFDQLAGEVVEEVTAREPSTVIYVMHVVPSAPMQRILYEVYQDAAAFEEHQRQPYVQRFTEERGPCVLATNVVELGVRHGKAAPLAGPARPMGGRDLRPWGDGAR